MATLPSFAKIQEARLYLSGLPTGGASEVTRRRLVGPPLQRTWRLSIGIAPFHPDNSDAWIAYVAGRDGLLGAVHVSMTGALSQAYAGTLALAANAPALARQLSLTASQTVLPGTMITVGTVDGTHQLLEVLDRIEAGATTSVRIAPYLRKARLAGVTVSGGSAAVGWFRLANDDAGASSRIVSRVTTELELIERVSKT
jgi:hypothetical protein